MTEKWTFRRSTYFYWKWTIINLHHMYNKHIYYAKVNSKYLRIINKYLQKLKLLKTKLMPL